MKMKYFSLIIALLFIGLIPIATTLPSEGQTQIGYAYEFQQFGDIYNYSEWNIVQQLNNSWTDNPDEGNWWQNESLVFCWDYQVIPSTICTERAELYICSNGNNTLYLDYLTDSTDYIIISLWNHTANDWIEIYHPDYSMNDMWIKQSFSLSPDVDNGTVLVRWEFTKTFGSSALYGVTDAHWMPALYIDFATIISTPISSITEDAAISQSNEIIDTIINTIAGAVKTTAQIISVIVVLFIKRFRM